MRSSYETVTQPTQQISLKKTTPENDAAIFFPSKVEEAKLAEKISPFFFNQIEQNQKKSNVERLCTPEFPKGTNSQEETTEALESHFSKTFGDTDPEVQVDDIWWDGLQSIDDATKTKLDSPITLNELTTVLFKEMAPNK
jgi:hypothetical protein